MPEVHIDILWPDASKDSIYSPSTVVRNYFVAGANPTVEEFESISEAALSAASTRVKERYGFECSSALGELARLRNIINMIQDKTLRVQIINVR